MSSPVQFNFSQERANEATDVYYGLGIRISAATRPERHSNQNYSKKEERDQTSSENSKTTHCNTVYTLFPLILFPPSSINTTMHLCTHRHHTSFPLTTPHTHIPPIPTLWLHPQDTPNTGRACDGRSRMKER